MILLGRGVLPVSKENESGHVSLSASLPQRVQLITSSKVFFRAAFVGVGTSHIAIPAPKISLFIFTTINLGKKLQKPENYINNLEMLENSPHFSITKISNFLRIVNHHRVYQSFWWSPCEWLSSGM